MSADRPAGNYVHRYAAFTRDPETGNPAGVLPEARGLSDADMLRIAAEVGFSDTAFLIRTAENTHDVRYFSPRIEVPFCSHATIAAGRRRSSWKRPPRAPSWSS